MQFLLEVLNDQFFEPILQYSSVAGTGDQIFVTYLQTWLILMWCFAEERVQDGIA